MQGFSSAFSWVKTLSLYLSLCTASSLFFATRSNAANWLSIEDASFINSPNEFWIHASTRTFNLYKQQPAQKCSELIYQSMLEDSSRPLVLKHYHTNSVEYFGQKFFGTKAAWSNFHPTSLGLDSNTVLSNVDVNLPLSRFRVNVDLVESFEKLSKNISYEKFDARFGYFTLIAKEHVPPSSTPTPWEAVLRRNLGGSSLKCTAQLSVQ